MPEVQPEIKDINEMINRFCASNKGQTAFICGVIGFTEDGFAREDANFLRVYGHIKELDEMIRDIKKIIKQFKNKHGTVNL